MSFSGPAARFAFSTTLALLAALPCPAADSDAQKHTLHYKFEIGDVLRYDIEHDALIRSTMEGSTQKAQTRSQSVKAWKVIDVLPNGEIELQHVVEELQMTNRLPERAEVSYDSTKDKAPPAGFEDAAKAVGVPLSHIRLTPWGKVVNHEVKHHQPAADPYAPLAVLLPEKAVAVGDSWDEPVEIKVNLSEGGTKAVTTRRHFRLASVKNGVAVIESAFQTLSPVTPEMEGQLAQRYIEGTVRFDIKRGRVLSQEYDVDKRVLGFAGPASSMHYRMHMTERLQDGAAVASRPSKTEEK